MQSGITVVVSRDGDRALRAATRRFIEQAAPTSVHLNLHERDDGYVFGPHTRTLAGSSHITERVAGATFTTKLAYCFCYAEKPPGNPGLPAR